MEEGRGREMGERALHLISVRSGLQDCSKNLTLNMIVENIQMHMRMQKHILRRRAQVQTYAHACTHMHMHVFVWCNCRHNAGTWECV